MENLNTIVPPSPPKNRKLGIIGIAVLLFIVGYIVGRFSFPAHTVSVAPIILDITQPVYSITGKVNSISGNSIVLEYQPTLPLPVGSPIAIKSDVAGKKIDFVIHVTPNTTFRTFTPILGSSGASLGHVSLSAMQTGQTITVTSSEDLRTLSQNQFEASSIALPPPITNLFGTIIDISNTILTIKATIAPIPLPSSQAEIYKIAVTPNTTITKVNYGIISTPSSAQQKLAISDLNKGMQVEVITNADVIKSTNLEAVQILVTSSLPLPTSPAKTSQSASSSARP